VIARDYAGPEDLQAMQRLTQALWSFDQRHHIGDLAWQRFEHIGHEPDWPTRLWVWDGRVVAWGWIYEHEPDLLYLQVDPAHPALHDDVLDWFESIATTDKIHIEVTNRESALIEALTSRGYAARDGGAFGLLNARSLDDLPALNLPNGLAALSMAEAPDADRRSAAHHAAWSRIAGREHLPRAASLVTGESYRQVMAAWPYRPDLDWVLEDGEGRWVANCCVWLDEANGVGELEPVGVDADFRRRGYGYLICLAGLHALRRAGATTAIVGARGDDDYPVPRRLYFSLGFSTYARTVNYERQRLAGPEAKR